MRLTRFFLLAVALSTSPFLLADSDAARRAAAAAQADTLKEALATFAKGPVHDLGDEIGRVDTHLGSLQEQMAVIQRNLNGPTLADLATGQRGTSSDIAALISQNEAFGRRLVAEKESFDQWAAKSDQSQAQLRAQLDRSLLQLNALGHDWTSAGQALAKTWAASTDTLSSAQGQTSEHIDRVLTGAAWAGGALVAALGCAMLAAFLILRRSNRAQVREIDRSVNRLAVDVQGALAGVARPPSSAASAFEPEMESRLRLLADRLEGAAQCVAALNPPPPPSSTHASERPTRSVGAASEPAIASRLLWPPEFMDPGSPLSRWRFLLESHFEHPDHPALPVLAAFLGLRAALERSGSSTGEIGTAAHRLSESLHAYLQSLTDLSPEDRQQASGAWLSSMRSLMGRTTPRLDLREILPGSRVDPDLMNAVKEGPGNHLNVAEVFSWAVLERSADRPRVLHRALVAST